MNETAVYYLRNVHFIKAKLQFLFLIIQNFFYVLNSHKKVETATKKEKKLLMQRNNRKQAMSVFPALCIEREKNQKFMNEEKLC
jgi:hypothetical protein